MSTETNAGPRTATLHQLPPPLYPEHLSPVFDWPAVGGPLNATSPKAGTSGERNQDARCDIDKLLEDMRSAWAWAKASHVAVLSVDADRNGAYLRLAASPRLRTLFGDECAMIQRHEKADLRTETWLGCIGHIRVFWREVTCVH